MRHQGCDSKRGRRLLPGASCWENQMRNVQRMIMPLTSVAIVKGMSHSCIYESRWARGICSAKSLWGGESFFILFLLIQRKESHYITQVGFDLVSLRPQPSNVGLITLHGRCVLSLELTQSRVNLAKRWQ